MRVVLIAAGLAVVGAVVALSPHAGRFLVAEDRFEHAEVGLILSGGAVIRALAARDLYREGRIDRILVIPEPENPLKEELLELGLFDPDLPPWSERILRASGVPRSKITFLPEPAHGTIVEALRVREFLKDDLPETLVVITSKFAARRAGVIFRHILKDEPVTVLTYPSPYGLFEPDRWWGRPRNALRVVNEYQKLLVNAFTLTFGLYEG